jgi:Gram-negative bacterial TonB protein C-terminal
LRVQSQCSLRLCNAALLPEPPIQCQDDSARNEGKQGLVGSSLVSLGVTPCLVAAAKPLWASAKAAAFPVLLNQLKMGLDEETLAVVTQYKFKPATFQGKPVPVVVNIEVSFRIC